MRTSRHIVILVGSAIVITACAQIQGLDSYEKVDCLDDCDAGIPPVPETGPMIPDVNVPDAAKTCPGCGGATPVCDPKSLLCVACLPGVKECAKGQFCDAHPTLGYRCAVGCATTPDCFGKVDAGDADGGDGGADSPIACCSNRCVDTTIDAQHCGGCGLTCAGASKHVPAPTCSSGGCNGACESGYSDCNSAKLVDGCEVNTAAQPDNCGACGTVCSNANMASRTCNGTCNGTCTVGFADCNANKQTDGCEANITNDPVHCGTCATKCSGNHIATPTCGASKCNGACAPGWSDCNLDKATDGCEANVKNDTANCNACGAPCAAGVRKCDFGTCKAGYGVTTSPQPFIDACGLAGMARYLNAGEDDAFGPIVAMPFPFTFFGAAQTQYWVTSNGSLGFGPAQSNVVGAACPLPDAGYAMPLVMGFNDDLVSRSGPTFGVCVGATGAAPNRKLVATWQQAAFFDVAGPPFNGTITFSIVLSETTNTIDVVFQTLAGPGNALGETAATGVQSGASPATSFNCSEGFMTSSTRVRFIP